MAIRFVKGGVQSVPDPTDVFKPKTTKQPIKTGGSSSSSQKGLFGTYDTKTQTYTSPSGEKTSVQFGLVPPGATIIYPWDKKTISGGGGGSSTGKTYYSSDLLKQSFATKKAMEEAEAKYKNQKEIEKQKQIEKNRELNARIEKARIERVKKEIIVQGANQRIQNLKNEKGERVRTITTEVDKIVKGKPTKVRVFEFFNLDTGAYSSKVYEKRKAGQIFSQTGGISETRYTYKDVKEMSKELPKGDSFIYNSNTMTIKGIKSNLLNKIYPYTNTGIEEYNKDLSKISSEEVKKVGKIQTLASKGDILFGKGVNLLKNNISEMLNHSGINIKNKSVSNYISKVIKNLKTKGINNLTKFRDFVDKERQRYLNQMKSSKFRFKEPTTYNEALKWTRNFDRYVGSKAIVTALDLGIATPQLINQLKSAPLVTIVSLPPAIIQGFKEDWKTIKSGEPFGIIDLATEYLVYTTTFNLAGKAIKTTSRGIMKVLPGTKSLKAGQIFVRKASKTKPSLVLKSQTVKSGSKSLSKQAKLAGKEVTAVTAQAQQLTSLLRRKKIIRKPIPGEANFPKKIKEILYKFDSGKRLTNKEFSYVNSWLRKNVAQNITLLERSLYLDPASGLRISRLGIQEPRTATIRDILRGNFKLWNRLNKPQILIFENAKIAKFPKSLKKIEKKLKLGQKLTTKETNRLIRWQVETGKGKFKPIGSTIYAGGKELEITLAPGEMIKQVKRLGRVYIDGRKVTIVSAEIFKPSKAILKQMKLAELGKLSLVKVNKLNKLLSKKLGRKVKVETPEVARRFIRKEGKRLRRSDSDIPILRVRGMGIIVLRIGIRGLVDRPSIRKPVRIGDRVKGRVVRGGRVIRKPAKRTPERRVVAKRTIMPVRTVRRVSRGVRRVSRGVRRVSRGLGKQKPIIPLKLSGFTKQKLSKAVPTYYVVEKVRGKFKKLYPKPLTLEYARDYATYSIDNRLSKTAFFIPMGKNKKVVVPPKVIKGYYFKNSNKFRPYRIRFGKKRQLVNGYIEKRKYFQDTIGEKTSLRNLRRTSLRRKPKRKLTPSQKKILLERLTKARAIRMKNLKRGK